jgi:hypothetical protein
MYDKGICTLKELIDEKLKKKLVWMEKDLTYISI